MDEGFYANCKTDPAQDPLKEFRTMKRFFLPSALAFAMIFGGAAPSARTGGRE